MEALHVKREMEKGKRRDEKGEVEKERGRGVMRKERWKRKLVR